MGLKHSFILVLKFVKKIKTVFCIDKQSGYFTPPKDVQITTYANDVTITAFHSKHCKTQQLIQPYLHKIYEWATINNLHINTNKTTNTLLYTIQLYYLN